MTVAISSRDSDIATSRTPSRPSVCQSICDCGPPLTTGDVGGVVYAASMADPPASAWW